MKRAKKRTPKKAKQRVPRALLYWRIRNGYSLPELSERTDLSTATLWRIERGDLTPTIRTRIKLMDGLRLSERQIDLLLAPSVDRARVRLGRRVSTY